MNNKAIGVFDSGLGGLCAVRVLRKLMPEENIIYFGDTGRMPYGGRPISEIRKIASQNIEFVETKGVKAIIAACGTISSNAQDIIAENPTKIIGVLTPGAMELAATGKKRLGVIATATSIASGSFEREVKYFAPDAEVSALACPEFVPMIESGHFEKDDELVREVVERTLRPFKENKIEAVLLGCTHYGIIAEAISEYLGGDVILVGAADASARAMCAYLTENGLLAENNADESYYTSSSVSDFEKLAPIMLGYEMKSGAVFVPPFPIDEV